VQYALIDVTAPFALTSGTFDRCVIPPVVEKLIVIQWLRCQIKAFQTNIINEVTYLYVIFEKSQQIGPCVLVNVKLYIRTVPLF